MYNNMRVHVSHCFYTIILCQLIWAAGTQSAWLGPTFPAARDLTSDSSIVAASWANVTSAFDSYIAGNGGRAADVLSGLKNHTFSVSLFSLHDPQAARTLQFHHTNLEVSNATTGVTQVDGDSVYRIASVTKVFTVFAGLLNLESEYWDRPITDFVPGLAEFARQTNQNLVHVIQWEKVTLRALAAQLGGIPRDVTPYARDFLPPALVGLFDPISYGLPPLNVSDPSVSPPCRYDPYAVATNFGLDCPGYLWVEGIKSRPPIFLPWASPAYANAGFTLLGLAIANITGKPFADVMGESIFDPIGMTSTSYLVPTNFSHAVIPDKDPATAFTVKNGDADASGGIYSTVNDMSKFGVAILNSTLLPPEETRRWLKPVSHTATLIGSTGAPWEIIRYTQPVTGAVTDIYTKGGDLFSYSSFFVLLPDHDAGFNIMVAATTGQVTQMRTYIADIITSQVLPALESQAAREAEQNFAGTYRSNTPGLNSSLSLVVNTSSGVSGLHIESWISNGTDMLRSLDDLAGSGVRRLLPSISGSGEVAFRSSRIRPSPNPLAELGPFSNEFYNNLDWVGVDSTQYGAQAFDLFMFELGEDGRAVSITPAVTRARMEKTA